MSIRSYLAHTLSPTLAASRRRTTRPPAGDTRPEPRQRLRSAVGATIERMEGRVLLAGDTAPVAAFVSAPAITTGTTNTELVVASFTDTDGTPVAAASLKADNIVVTGPNGALTTLTVTGVTPDSLVDAPTISVTYTVQAPGGTNWSNADNGSYNVALSNTVTDDLAGTPNAVTPVLNFGTFSVNVAAADTGPTPAFTSSPPITTGAASTELVTVTYTDNDGTPVKAASFNINNISVTGPAPATTTLLVTGFTPDVNADGATRIVTYTVQAPGATNWSAADNGTYNVALNTTVTDTVANPVVAHATFGTFSVNVAAPGPVATLTPPTAVTTAGGASELITVTYTDAAASITPGSITANNITVTGPAPAVTPLTVSSVSTTGSGATVTATYTVAAPAPGTFSSANNGTYNIALAGNVTDAASNTVTANPNFGTFAVNIAAPGPVATLTPPTAVTTAGGASELITVTYTDTAGTITPGSITTSNITVTGPAPAVTPLTVSAVSTTGVGATVTATYTVAAPAPGTFSSANNGTYNIALAGNVTDSAAHTLPANPNFGTFAVNIPAAGLAATLTPPTPVTIAGGTSELVIVTYTDTLGTITPGSIATNNITVTGPAPAVTPLTVSAVSTTGSGATVTATYTVSSPASAPWALANNGTYNIALAGNVTDSASNTVTANPTFGTFTVNIGAPADTAPTVALTPPTNVTTAGGTTETIVITYTDNDGTPVQFSSITTGNITVTGPNNTTLTVSGVTVNNTVSAPTLVATYTVHAPAGGSWSAANSGTYHIALTATVTDTAAHAVTANPALGTFAVTIADNLAPTAQFHSTDILFAGGFTHSIVVTYLDNTAIDTNTISDQNVIVTAPDGTTTLPVVGHTTLLGTSPGTVIVTYTVSQPTFTDWSAADNGVYSVSLATPPDAVTDLAGNPVPALPSFGAFTVGIQDINGPKVTQIAAPVVSTPGQQTETITITLTDDVAIKVGTININDLTVTGPHGESLHVESVSLDQATDGPTRTATFVVDAPAGSFNANSNGSYTIVLSGVTDTSGNPLAAATASGSFSVNITNPTPPTVLLGSFGFVKGKQQKLRFRDIPDGTIATLTVKGGSGQAYQEGGSNAIDLVITDGGQGVTVTVTTKDGGPLTLNNVRVNGTLKSFTAPTANVIGTMFVDGTVTKATFRHLVGNFVTSGPILNLSITRAVTQALVLSGANLGADGVLGGGDDTFGSGFIGKMTIGGAIAQSLFAVGIAPGADGVYGTADDVKAGTAISRIDALTTAHTIDSFTKFEAGQFGKFTYGKKTFFPNPATDGRYVQFS